MWVRLNRKFVIKGSYCAKINKLHTYKHFQNNKISNRFA